ncbi:p48 [Morganella morganii]|nr:p48 [Morganella morganii]
MLPCRWYGISSTAVKERAVGHEVNKSLTPGQEFVKIVQGELVAAMGEENNALDLSAQPPAVVLMAGLQGAGKTTSVAKLGKLLKEKHKKKVLVVSADVYRPRRLNSYRHWQRQWELNFSRLMCQKNRLISLKKR